MNKSLRYSFYILIITLPFVSYEYRVFNLPYYDIAIVFFWVSILLNMKDLDCIDRKVFFRTNLLIISIVLGGGLASIISMLIDISMILGLFRLISAYLVFFGVFWICSRYPQLLTEIPKFFILLAIIQISVFIPQQGSFIRFSGTFHNPNFFGNFQLAIFFITISYSIQIKFKFLKIILLLISSFSLLTLLLSYSRGAYVGLLAGMIYLLFFMILNRNFKKIIIRTILIFIIVFVLYFLIRRFVELDFLFLQLDRRLNIDVIQYSGYSGRINIWRRVIESIVSNPFGYGWGASRYVIDRAEHNTLLSAFLQLGFIGFICLLTIFVLSFIDIIIIGRNEFFSYHIGYAASTVAMCVHSFSINLLDSRQFWFVLAITASAAINIKNNINNKTGKNTLMPSVHIKKSST